MILKIIISLAAAFGIYWSIKTKKSFPSIITIGMIAGIALVFFPTQTIAGLYVYMVFVALAFIYGLVANGNSNGDRIII